MPIPDLEAEAEASQNSTKRSYPSKIFNLAEHYIPKDVKSLFKFCEYYYLTSAPLYQAITKSAEYRITDLVIETPDK